MPEDHVWPNRIVTPEQAAQACLRAGFTRDQTITMVAIGMAESGLDTHAVGDTGTSWGVWQIHTAGIPPPGWHNLQANAVLARAKFLSQGFDAWCTWEGSACGGNGRGTYKAHMARARKAVESTGAGKFRLPLTEVFFPKNEPKGHGGSNAHLHVAADADADSIIVKLGRVFRKKGYTVTGHPLFPPVGHTDPADASSYHNRLPDRYASGR